MIEISKNEVNSALGEKRRKEPIAEKLIRNKAENEREDYKHREEER